uniref:Glycosyl transferase 48 domain-containing protein n=1 Tax=Brassica oleracea var. oleracea TaxID=109376 RepID=A0A0D3BTE0_BRAOL
MVGSFLFAPFLFNPSGFEWQKVFDDWKDWTKWIYEHDFEGFGVPSEKSWESWWEKEQGHLRHSGVLGVTIEVILASRFFVLQYGIVYQLTAFEENHSIWIYVGSWFVVVIIMLIVKVLGEASPGGTNSHCAFRTTKLVVFLTSVINVIGITVVHLATFGDLFLCMISQACKPLTQRLGLWPLVMKLAWGYDFMMGFILFAVISMMSMFFGPEIQIRLPFNQAFSRGLMVSHILSGRSSANNQD